MATSFPALNPNSKLINPIDRLIKSGGAVRPDAVQQFGIDLLKKIGFNDNDFEAVASALALTGQGGPATTSSQALMPQYGMRNPRYEQLFKKLFSTKVDPEPPAPRNFSRMTVEDIVRELDRVLDPNNPFEKDAQPRGGNKYIRYQPTPPKYNAESPAIPRVRSNIAYYGNPDFSRIFSVPTGQTRSGDWPGGQYSVQRKLSEVPGAVVVPGAEVANKHSYLSKILGAKQAEDITEISSQAYAFPSVENFARLKDFIINRKYLTEHEFNNVIQQGFTHFPEYLKDKMIEKWMNQTGTRALVVQKPKKVGAELIERVDKPGVPVKLTVGDRTVILNDRYKRRTGDLKNWINNQLNLGMPDYQVIGMLREQGFIE